jgi:hypothetical protein
MRHDKQAILKRGHLRGETRCLSSFLRHIHLDLAERQFEVPRKSASRGVMARFDHETHRASEGTATTPTDVLPFVLNTARPRNSRNSRARCSQESPCYNPRRDPGSPDCRQRPQRKKATMSIYSRPLTRHLILATKAPQAKTLNMSSVGDQAS